MEILICLFILFLKILETSLGTFRIIILSNGKKILSSILSGVIALIWVISTGLVILDIKESFLRIIFLILGCMIGSYIGSLIEEKIAIGNHLLITITCDSLGAKICDLLRKNNFAVTVTKARGIENIKNILFIMAPRKKQNKIKKIILSIDNNAMIICESASVIKGGYI